MAKKEKVSKPDQVCSECACSTWQWKHEHLDLQGKPICLTCPHEEYWIIRGTVNNACTYIVKEIQKTWGNRRNDKIII